MRGRLDITLLEPHALRLHKMLADNSENEAAAYLQFGTSDIAADPWSGQPRTRLVSHQFRDIDSAERVDASPVHVTWSTAGFMRLLSEAKAKGHIPAVVHTHPGSHAFFSDQDNTNEAELARTAFIKGVRGLVSLVLGGDGSVRARVWLPSGEVVDAAHVQQVGGRFHRWFRSADAGAEADHLDRQARLFGSGFNDLVRSLRIGVVGCGGTGSPVAMLLARLGVGYILLIDDDLVETTNLNRVHGSRRSDAVAGRLKIDVIEREIVAAELGVEVKTRKGWANAADMRDALKSCDFIFGCTDDHAGRIMLNRLAYFYGIPVIDVGLRMMPISAGPGHDINGRITTLSPGRPCLLCSGVVNARRASEEALERSDPAEFRKRKQEAYVVGAGDPAPAVVTFTTEMACVAVNEMIAALTGFHGEEGMVPNRLRRFHARDDRFLATKQSEACRVCTSVEFWGRADVDPFLDMIG
jgi:molybdopterin/thiamine biosynthesis adenylyltransferase/proteasome lid subunit RPN8/RPN11